MRCRFTSSICRSTRYCFDTACARIRHHGRVLARGAWLDGPAVRFRTCGDGGSRSINIANFRLKGGVEPLLLRVLVAVFLVGLAVQSYWTRYSFLDDDHGFMVGADYVNTTIGIPLQWLSVAAFLFAAVLVLLGRWKWAVTPVAVAPAARRDSADRVRRVRKPNELALQRPYIKSHIDATRAAYGLDSRLKEVQHPGQFEAPIDPVRIRRCSTTYVSGTGVHSMTP